MKIGILTQPLYNNWGGNIQNWALQQVLRRMGHRPVTINACYECSGNSLRNYAWRLKNFGKAFVKRYILHDWSFFVNNPLRCDFTYSEPRRIDSSFRRRIAKTKYVRLNASDWEKRAEIDSFDAFIVGSDQVWRQEYSPKIETYFLNFLKDSDHRPRIAYAASFGCDNPIKDDLLPLCTEALHRFKAVSVRETSSIDILQRDFGYTNAVKVLDPTLLLTSADYETLIQPKDRNGACIANYILDATPPKKSIASSISNATGTPLRTMALTYNGFRRPTMSQWLAMFADASIVITDSFHGSVFSIIFHKPFIAIANANRGLDRFISLLGELGLSSRLISDSDNFDIDNLKSANIDWQEVDHRLNSLRKNSLDFLTKALHS